MILDEIVAKLKLRIKQQKQVLPLKYIEKNIILDDKKDIFKNSLIRPGIQIIAEIKRASPSAGVIAEDFDPMNIAKDYASVDVAAISILTEEDYFKGSLEILQNVRQVVTTPLLRKDFIIDPYQIYQAKLYGANCVLLIASILTKNEITDFINLTKQLQLNALIEVHNKIELEKVLATNAEIIGINNRDLKTFNVDLQTSFNLKKLIPEDKIVVSESGVKTREQVTALDDAGFEAILIGETFMRSINKAELINHLIGKRD